MQGLLAPQRSSRVPRDARAPSPREVEHGPKASCEVLEGHHVGDSGRATRSTGGRNGDAKGAEEVPRGGAVPAVWGEGAERGIAQHGPEVDAEGGLHIQAVRKERLRQVHPGAHFLVSMLTSYLSSGHERVDVVQHRQEVFIPTLNKLRPRIVEYEVGNVGVKVVKDYGPDGPLEVIFHDKSTFQAHDAQAKAWVLENQHQLRKKGVGRGVHRSDFIGPSHGCLEEGGVGMNYGKNHDGYWTGDDVCTQVSCFLPLAPHLRR